MSNHFDVVVLGAGPGGYTAAIRAAQLGNSVAVVEDQLWGGVCLNIGCIPTKALLHNAEVAQLVTMDADSYGMEVDGQVRFAYDSAFRRSRTVAEGRVKGIHYLMKRNKIAQFNGYGRFLDQQTLKVLTADRDALQVTFDHCIIATGARARLLPSTAVSERVVTYKEHILNDQLPNSIIIIGGGPIGVEFAYILRAYGVDVTIIETLDRLVPTEDEEISAELERRYRRLGVNVMTSTRVESVDDTSTEAVQVVVTQRGQSRTVRADRVIQAIGFVPCVDGFGLENTGVALTEGRAIGVDEHCRTNVPHISAIGDVTAKLMLAHTAEAMGIVAAESLAGVETVPVDYLMVPRNTYCQPQIASFGLTETEAVASGYDTNIARFSFSANGKANGMGQTTGFVKILSDAHRGEILGAHLIGPGVTELLPELTLAQQWELTVHEVARNIHAHPTLSEAVKEAVHGLAGHMVNM
jgi:dihydrolipoamide dehydrogenase